jgi:PHD/YefM family antitoxin component YafN of YafNO toxin-antitoxin module
MRTILAQEIKRRGIGAVDELLEQGPVHVIARNRPRYVILQEDHYQELLDDREEAYAARVKAACEDVAAGRTRRFASVAELMAAIGQAGDEDEPGR